MEFGDDGALRVDPEKLAASMTSVRDIQAKKGIAGTPEDWFAQVLVHEGIHAADVQVAKAKGQTIQQRYEALPDGAMPEGWQKTGRDVYGKEWDGLQSWQRKAEFVRQVIEGKYSGKLTEQLYRFIQESVDFLKGVAGFKGTDPRFQTHVEEVERRIESARQSEAAEQAETRSTPPRSFKMPTAPAGYSDALDHIAEQGGMLSPAKAQKLPTYSKYQGDYDGAPKLGGFYHHAVFGGRMMPDRMAQILHENHGVGDGSVDGMWNAIGQARDLRDKVRAQKADVATQEQQATAFDKDAVQATTAKKGAHPINAGDLNVGDKVKIGDQTLKVIDVDPDTLDVTLEDHSKYGVQKVADGQALFVEKVARAAGGGDSTLATARPDNVDMGRAFPEDRPFDFSADDLPKLRPGEKGTGELFQGDDQPFNLAGEKGIDHDARQAAQEQAARDTAAANARQDRDQRTLSAARPNPDDTEAPSRVFERWKNLADDPASFRYGTTEAKDPQAVADNYSRSGQEIKGKLTANGAQFSSPHGWLQVRLRAPLPPEGERSLSKPTPAYISSENAGSEGQPAGGGDQLYQSALSWARNNGIRIKADPHGLAPIATLRRTSQMFSSALRQPLARGGDLMGVDKTAHALAAHSDTIKSFTDASIAPVFNGPLSDITPLVARNSEDVFAAAA